MEVLELVKLRLLEPFVRTVTRLRIKVSLLAPTGRAAKVFSLNAGVTASTIHRKIYREKTFNGTDGQFQLNNNMFRNMLFMVDEASMISTSLKQHYVWQLVVCSTI